jgi:hypothetical protein
MRQKPPVLTLAERLSANGNLALDEVAALAAIGLSTLFKHVKEARLKTHKLGRRTFVRAADAVAYIEGRT